MWLRGAGEVSWVLLFSVKKCGRRGGGAMRAICWCVVVEGLGAACVVLGARLGVGEGGGGGGMTPNSKSLWGSKLRGSPIEQLP